MKFEILDSHVHAHGHAHAHAHAHGHTRGDKSSSTKYQYLDELFDRTFITDYFMDRASKDNDAAAAAN
jgi:hypothetical protein